MGAVFALASVLGPFIGGVLTDHGDMLMPGIEGWRWVFYVNLPFGLLALGFIWSKMPTLQPPATHRVLDWNSTLLFSGALAALVLALQLDKQAHPWNAPETIGLFLLAALLLVLFVRQARRSPSPILDLGLFRERVFTTSVLALLFMGAAFLNIVLFAPLFLINVAGVSARWPGSAWSLSHWAWLRARPSPASWFRTSGTTGASCWAVSCSCWWPWGC